MPVLSCRCLPCCKPTEPLLDKSTKWRGVDITLLALFVLSVLVIALGVFFKYVAGPGDVSGLLMLIGASGAGLSLLLKTIDLCISNCRRSPHASKAHSHSGRSNHRRSNLSTDDTKALADDVFSTPRKSVQKLEHGVDMEIIGQNAWDDIILEGVHVDRRSGKIIDFSQLMAAIDKRPNLFMLPMNKHGDILFHIAIRQGDEEAVARLKKHPNVKDQVAIDAFTLCCQLQRAADEGSPEIAKMGRILDILSGKITEFTVVI